MELTKDRHHADLLSFYRDLQSPNVVFLLGAGASAPYVPLSGSLLELVERRYNELWAFPYDKRDPRTCRFIGRKWCEWLNYAPWNSVAF
jgi:hypothetical protein